MKRLFLLAALTATVTLSGCLPEQWATNNNNRDYRYEDGRTPPPPPDNRYDNRGGYGYDNRGGYGYDSRGGYGYDNRGGYGYDNRGGYGRYNGRPAIGTEVGQLPGSARRVVSDGQELYISNGVMYQPIRSRAGVVYRVVGYSDY